MIFSREMREPDLPYPTRPLEVQGGIVDEFIIPDDKKEEVLKKLYPFIPVPSLHDELYDIHEEKKFLVKEYRVVRDCGAILLVSPYYPSSGGSVIDWVPPEFAEDE